MKTISKRFLKGGLALLLAFVMLFGTTITGFAAVVDNAETSAQYNIYWQGHVYFLAPETWDIDTYKYIQIDITRTTSPSSSNYQYYAGTMTRLGSSRLFYYKMDTDHRSWGQNEYLAFTANSSTYGSGKFTLQTNKYYTIPLDYDVTNANGYYLFKPSNETNNSTTTKGNTMSGSYDTSRNVAKATQTVNITTDGLSDTGGKVSLGGYYFSADNNIAQSTATSTSATISYDGAVQGSAMTLTATPNSGYKFVGWYNGGTLLNSSTSYTYNVFDTKTITAKFEADGYSYTVTAGEGGTASPASGTASSVEITATPNTGYSFDKWTVTNGSVVDASSATTTFTPSANNANAHATFKRQVAISVNGTKVADKAIGSEFSYEITAPSGQYLSGATTNPAVNFEIVDGKITFTVPDENVNIVPSFADYSYVELSDSTGITATGLKTGYKAGEQVTITLSPENDATSITNVVADVEGVAEITKTGNNWTITIASMPADTTITLTPTVDAKFTVKSKQVAIGNYGTDVTVFGTVEMKDADGNALAEGAYVNPDDMVTYKATATANYTFVGFYSDEACDQPIKTTDGSTSVQITGDTTVYALFARRQYMTYDRQQTSGDYVKELVYDPAIGAYTHTTTLADKSSTSAISKGAWFLVTNNTGKWSNYISHTGFTHTFDNNGYGATVSEDTGNSVWKLSTSGGTGENIKFILKPTSDTTFDFSATTVKEGSIILLSNGSLTMPGSLTATSVFTPAIAGTTSHTTSHRPNKVYTEVEKYQKANINTAQTITFETTLSGTDAANYYVDSFVVYDMMDKTFQIIAPVSSGSNVYSGSVFVDSDCYIVPIFMHTEEWLAANNMVAIDVYFDATAIKGTEWGPFVAAYAYGPGEEYFGVWPGQLMIPTEDGTSFFTQLEVPAAGSSNAAQGIVFNNYIFTNAVTDNASLFGVGTTNNQTYDYREAITIYEEEYNVITFVSKSSEDGYHGDHANGQSVVNKVSTSTNAKSGNYKYEYLVGRDGVTPMDLTGKYIENAVKVDDFSNVDYYVISKGDVYYQNGGYSADNNYNGDWSVDWYIFDKDGKYLTHKLSTAMWHDHNNDGLTVLEEALGLKDGELDGKLVAITYEAPNNNGHQLAFDGQWYGNILEDDVHANVMVGLMGEDGNPVIDNEDPTNVALYGEGWLVAEEDRPEYTVGEKYPELDISLDHGSVYLSSTAKEGYIFEGWYTEANGKYTKISDAYDYQTYINLNTTYYALFRPIEEGAVVINHTVYSNPNDPAIPSHGGVGEMIVQVFDSTGKEITSGTPSTSRSTVSFEGREKEVYTVKITTTPLLNGEFFAWYTDSTNVDGTTTYEEVFTDGTQIGSKQTVVAEFEYEYTHDSQKVINIYSDVKRVENKATLVYKYYNRFGELRTYTVKDVPLTDEECLGFPGNKGKGYVPAYLTAYTFMKNGEEVVVYGEDRYNEYIANGYEYLGSYNKISAYAPKSDVTEVFDGTVVWDVADTQLTTERSLVTLFASQGVPTYTINYKIGDQSGSKTDFYNELIKVEAPATYDGDAFSYWYEPATGEILTYSRFYNYRIVEDKTIVAVFGETNLQEWVPSINSITKTREFADGGDYIYTDHLLAFNNVDGKVLKDVQADEKIEYGLMILRDADYYIENPDNVVYPDANDAEIAERLKTIASVRKKNSAFTAADGNKYNCYFYNLSDNDLTNFNRLDYYVKYDNNKLVDTSHYYREFAFTAVAYIIVDGTVYLSNPKTTNFFELGNQAVTDSTN